MNEFVTMSESRIVTAHEVFNNNRAKKEEAIEDYSDTNIIIDVIDEIEYVLHIHVNPFLIERIQ